MGLWDTRNESLRLLDTDWKAQADVIGGTFNLIDESIRIFEAEGSRDAIRVYERVCALTGVKGRNLALGMFSLTLDGLGQEAGALLRPLIEAHEKLIWFRLDPKRAQRVFTGKMPTAGAIAKDIRGQFQDLREYLNEHASHFGVTSESLKHVLDVGKSRLILRQPCVPTTLAYNISSLHTVLWLFLHELCMCLDAVRRLPKRLAQRVELQRQKAIDVFGLTDPNAETAAP